MNTRYFLVHGTTVVQLDRNNSYIVPVDEFNEAPSLALLMNAADNPGLAIIPVVEAIEMPEHEGYPDFDTVEAAGLDGTLRRTGGAPVTWEQVARALLARK